MGAKYVAWSVVERTTETELQLIASGMLWAPDIGDTQHYGQLFLFRCLFEQLVEHTEKEHSAVHWIGERFVHQGSIGHGQSSEEINLRLATMKSVMPYMYMVRNTDWKTWFKRNSGDRTTDRVFVVPTPHQADAAGIACYGAAKCFGQ
jgi:hypothetical protein